MYFEYLSPDALPRFTRAAFVKEGDSLAFSEPDYLQSRFSYKNLSSGRYTFYIDVFEQNGEISHYQYAIVINKYWWQQWWVWVLISLAFFSPIALWLDTRRKQAVQAKEISKLNAVTLSNQFRPHFILNALNAIGTDLKDKPSAESLISRLGESINLIFSHSQKQLVYHSLKNEWTLVENVIQIHKIIYLPELELSFSGTELISTYENINVPMGILETNVENALLHGLRNKKEPPYQLSISINPDKNYLRFTISDNGIGKKNATSLSSYKTHGTGIRNLNAIIDIFNKVNKHKITVGFMPGPNPSATEGTTVLISIPLNYQYEY